MLNDKNQMLSAEEVGGLLGITGQSVRRWVKIGKLAGIQLGTRSLRIPASAVEQLLQQK
jgi:excisionase family DNA binding protein